MNRTVPGLPATNTVISALVDLYRVVVTAGGAIGERRRNSPHAGQIDQHGLARAAGLAAFTSEKSACRMAPGPLPLWSSVKMPGAVAATGTVTVFELTPSFCTTIVAVGPVSGVRHQEIDLRRHSRSRAARACPLISTVTPFSVAGDKAEPPSDCFREAGAEQRDELARRDGIAGRRETGGVHHSQRVQENARAAELRHLHAEVDLVSAGIGALIAAPTKALPAAPSPTCVKSAVPVPSAARV